MQYFFGDFGGIKDTRRKVLAHCVDNSGRWLKKSTMGVLTENFGMKPKEMYENSFKVGKNHTVGSLQYIELGNTVVCNIIGQQFYMIENTKKAAPPISYAKLEDAIVELCKYSKKNGCVIYFQKLHHSIPNLDWNDIEAILTRCINDYRIELILYVESTYFRVSRDKMETPPTDSESSRDASSPFQDLVVCVSGYSKVDTEELVKMIQALGGDVKSSWIPFGKGRTTHLICDSATQIYEEFEKMGGGVAVSRRWVEESYRGNSRMDENSWKFHDLKRSREVEVESKKKEMKIETKKDIEPPKAIATNKSPSVDLFPVLFRETYYLCQVFNRQSLERYMISYGAEITDIQRNSIVTVCDNQCCKNASFSIDMWNIINSKTL